MSETPIKRRYINVPFADNTLAKGLGARWDQEVRRWYVPEGTDLALIYAWRKPDIDDEVDHGPH